MTSTSPSNAARSSVSRPQRRRQNDDHPPPPRLPQPHCRDRRRLRASRRRPRCPTPHRLPPGRPRHRPPLHGPRRHRVLRRAPRRLRPPVHREPPRTVRPRPGAPLGDLSTGNRRKVGIVQAFMHRPDLLILDEPTSGLDPLLQQEFHRLIREEVARGATVFLSSHVLPEVEALASRVGILRKGRLVTVASIDDLRRKARQRIDIFTAGPVPRGLFEAVPGVRSVAYHDGGVQLVVEGTVDAVIKAAAALTVERIHTPGQDLEDLFLEYYEASDET
ncbi:ABC transporter ATP-binding protein [Tepidiforma flava]|uniref:ABC transporter ATP-binding protein n=1 Tax=Tepidiforma flava TaxID=3004094 RepID=A0ABY7M6X3_9CHLR|nr:ABC transporter ATP-binding protein [Tepidiforma flava]WBL36277.1 ABC transporter ATP-binding protein [Tepidiforma flava]